MRLRIGLAQEWDYRTQPRRVLSFALGAKAALPAPLPAPELVDDKDFVIDPAKAERGMMVFETNCYMCHGMGMYAGGAAPDLKRSPVPLSLEALDNVVRKGALVSRGMPRYDEFSAEDIEGLPHYIRQRAREALAVTR